MSENALARDLVENTFVGLPGAEPRSSAPPEVVDEPTRVLVVDDDEMVRRSARRSLSRAGYEVLQAAGVEDGIELGKMESPTVAIVDLHMPSGSGLDVIHRLKEMLPDIHAIVLSGDPTLETRVDCFDAGADDFVSKPVYMRELVKRIARAEREQKDRLELTREKRRAEQLYVYGQEMASFLAHDLNNGFCVALANLDYMRMQGSVSDDTKNAFESTKWILHRMSVLTDNFLDIERLEEGSIVPSRAMVSLRGLISEVLEVNHTRKCDGVTAAVDCDSELHANVDGPLIERLFHNIVGNAMRYVDSGGHVHIRAECDDDRTVLRMTVSNTGSTIPKALCKTVFEKNDKPMDRKSRHGLGLYFCRLVCEAHGGTIGVSSDANQTLFEMEIPLV